MRDTVKRIKCSTCTATFTSLKDLTNHRLDEHMTASGNGPNNEHLPHGGIHLLIM